ncbi:ELWxxDGT repeat protein [Nocardioides sp. L-11A]|uniref:ELWxxDGT repeat protein n=1 Tax=Nocardioides sp. L-11A TaxID=3043848 RepID=UPI00249BBC8C|nr:hypothetical protein QJ852_26030 [Nocardioides sp. L-11A]
MSKGQQRARSRAIQQRAEHKARRRRLRKGGAGVAVAATAAIALSGLAPSAQATEGDPRLVKDIRPGADSGVGSWLSTSSRAVLNGVLYFVGTDDAHGEELWRSNGTPEGTFLVKDLQPGPDDSYLSSLAVLGNTLFIGSENGLWKSAGDAASTMLVTSSVDVGQMVATADTLYFAGWDNDHGTELWKSNGTAVGTERVKDIATGTYDYYGTTLPRSSSPVQLTPIGNTVYFSADDGATGRELWSTAGTSASTTRVKDINVSGTAYPDELTPVGSTLYFTADDGIHGQELWSTAGTSASTVLVKDINPGTYTYDGETYPASSYIQGMAAIGETLYFGANDGGSGALWRSNGTASSTVRITDAARPRDMIAAGDMLYFRGRHWDDETSGDELWRSNGTAAGTSLVKDLYPGTDPSYSYPYPNSSAPQNFAVAGTTLYFDAFDGVHGRELWAMDLAAPGTPPVPLAPVGPSAACVAATQSATSATGALAKAKAALKKAKKAHNAAKVTKAKKKVKKAKKKVASTAATKSAACG